MNSPKIKINDQAELRTTLLEVFNKTTHYQAVKWAKYIIDKVKDLYHFEEEVSKHIEQSLDYINKYSSQFNEVKAVRSLAFKIHSLARQAESLKNNRFTNSLSGIKYNSCKRTCNDI
ncbi:MAG: putative immunity protein [Candidatus Izemoplasmatales bacterium]